MKSETEIQMRRGLLPETIRLAWPAVLESFFISLAGMIDTMMVSSLGTYAVAAVGLTTQPKFITLAVFFSVNVAVSALVARRKGQNDRRNGNEVLVTAMLFTVAVCIVLSVLSVSLASPIISLCGSNSDTHDAAVTYFRVIQGGMIFNVLTMVINAAQRGAGNTRIAMTTNVVSSLVNICFNYLLINGNFGFPEWHLFGAAVATVLGTVASFAMSLHSLFKKDSFVSLPYIIREKVRASSEVMKSIWHLGYNLLIENFAMRVGFVTTAVIAAHLGTDAFAAHQVGMNFLSLTFSFGDGMQVAAVALIGRSLGEKRPDKARIYGSLCQKVGLGISLILAVIFFFFGKALFSLFFNEPDILSLGVLISRFIIVIAVFQISQVIYGGCLRGAGDVRYCLFASLLSVTLIRTIVTWMLTSMIPLGLTGIWLGVLSDQVSRFVLLRHRFEKGEWTQLHI
ncbi:MAG: MATE family efflux transporter [Erysipelotrichaceae bacterium]|jgi:putative MATE family efflux protein|nr:MATE family efflux transporter [Erysipelotrichaceae bacterium]MCI1325945.1 MATE family efflux transporter [Solobacterium sp.]MCH4043771.1 MATE family efflux transporter [Erysipelotrichaceae bacterium]MCH4120988.1 MATE family efflux transporter [Erysipelotrichaceae bacterium]MCI1362709.1 MATE family efflux transporter [Solobacterium sp.]